MLYKAVLQYVYPDCLLSASAQKASDVRESLFECRLSMVRSEDFSESCFWSLQELRKGLGFGGPTAAATLDQDPRMQQRGCLLRIHSKKFQARQQYKIRLRKGFMGRRICGVGILARTL